MSELVSVRACECEATRGREILYTKKEEKRLSEYICLRERDRIRKSVRETETEGKRER